MIQIQLVAARELIGNSLNRRGISVFRNIGFDLIPDCHAVHLGVIVDADTCRDTVGLLDGDILCSDVVNPAGYRILFDPFSKRR
jgi:hypothetical protein